MRMKTKIRKNDRILVENTCLEQKHIVAEWPCSLFPCDLGVVLQSALPLKNNPIVIKKQN